VKIAGPNEPGWPLRRHREHPDEPPSLIYFDLRTKDNPKPGPLTEEVLRSIGWQLQCLSRDLEYDLVIPIPNAGDPLARAFVEAAPFRMKLQRRPAVGMQKQNGRIVGMRAEDIPARLALPIDDVISGADSMLEGITKIRDQDLVVKDCLALIDREQGGETLLRNAGVEPHVVYKATDVLQLYVDHKRVDWPTANRVLEYIAANQFT